MGVPTFVGPAPPQDDSPPVYPVIAPATGERLEVTALGSSIFGYWCHWACAIAGGKARSLLCTDFEGDCPHCGKTRRFWQAFLPVYSWREKNRAILRFGPRSALNLVALVGSLRDLHLARLVVARPKGPATAGLVFAISSVAQNIPDCRPHSLTRTLEIVLSASHLPTYEVRADDIPVGDPS